MKEDVLPIILNYIQEEISIKYTYHLCINELRKLTSFLSHLSFFPSQSLFIDLIENSDTLRELLAILIRNEQNLNRSNRVEEIFNDEILLSLIECYCLLYNMDGKEIYFGNKQLNYSNYLYRKDIDNLSLSDDSDEILFMEIKMGNRKAREALIEKYLNLVNNVAKKYSNRHIEFQELVQAGNIGLIYAVDKFDYTLGTKFSTYAIWWIKKEIQEYILPSFVSQKLPFRLRHIYDRFSLLYERLSYLYQEPPTVEEIAKILNLSQEDIECLFSIIHHNKSLEELILTDKIEEESLLIEEKIDDKIDKDLLKGEIITLLEEAKLTDKEKLVLILKYGLQDTNELRVSEIARLLKLSVERVRQLEVSALKKIINTKKVVDFTTYMDRPEKSLEHLSLLRVLYKTNKNKYKRILIGKE